MPQTGVAPGARLRDPHGQMGQMESGLGGDGKDHTGFCGSPRGAAARLGVPV